MNGYDLVDNALIGDGGRQSSPLVPELGGQLPSRTFTRLHQPFLDRQGVTRFTLNVDEFLRVPDWRRDPRTFTRNESTGGEKRRLLRDYTYFELLKQGIPVTMNAATMTKDAWIHVQGRVLKAAREPLQAWDDLVAANSEPGFDAYSHMTAEYETMSDAGRAYVDLDLLTDGTTDTPLFDRRSVPLLITHCDFCYSDRILKVSANGSVRLDSAMAEQAGRRVSEMVEDVTIGNVAGQEYGTVTAGTGTHTGLSKNYGYTNFPQRLTKTNFTAPSAGGWVPSTFITELNVALNQLRAQFFYGPFVMYHSVDWTPYLDGDYYHAITSGAVAPVRTLRERIMAIGDITDIRRLNRLTSTFTIILVQFTGEHAPSAINGRGITILEWQEKGGLSHWWKVYVIQVAWMKSDYNLRTGILHGTTT